MLYIFIFQVFLFFLLNFIDAWTTYIIILAIGTKSEANPIARFFINQFGCLKGMIYLKSIIALLLPLIIWAYIQESVIMMITILVINATYLWVCIHNYKIILKIKKQNQ
ncbi:MAG: DUF5658 family protein [Candidatus Cloacimonetes bacterium]|nr:DUF5658 family protein [Candidatus Cloacimonadota bacterium]